MNVLFTVIQKNGREGGREGGWFVITSVKKILNGNSMINEEETENQVNNRLRVDLLKW